jgi:hypothetical protein
METLTLPLFSSPLFDVFLHLKARVAGGGPPPHPDGRHRGEKR